MSIFGINEDDDDYVEERPVPSTEEERVQLYFDDELRRLDEKGGELRRAGRNGQFKAVRGQATVLQRIKDDLYPGAPAVKLVNMDCANK